MRRACRVVVIFGALALGFGCERPGQGTPQIVDANRALAVADDLERGGHYDLARRQLADVAAAESRPRHRDLLALRICKTFLRQRAFQRARSCYEDRSKLGEEARGLALFYLAELDVGDGNEERAIDRIAELIGKTPELEVAQRAAKYGIGLAKEPDERLVVAKRYLAAVGSAHDDKVDPLFAFLAWEVGRNARAAGHLEQARQVLHDGWLRGEDTIWRDELMVERARVLRDQGDFDGAGTLYEEFLDERESSWFVGSYDSPYLGRAATEWCSMLADAGKTDEALDACRWLADEFPESRYLDDAEFVRARTLAKREGARALLEFVRRFPESRHVEEATRLAEQKR